MDQFLTQAKALGFKTEDLIYVLMEKGVLQFTDLPADAQRKLRARESFRGRRLKDALDLLGDGKG